LPRLWGRAGSRSRDSAGFGGCSLPGPANHPNPILILDFSFGLGGGTGPRWGVVRVSRVSPARAATGLPRMKLPGPAGSRDRVWASRVRVGLRGSRAPCSRPRQGVLGPTLKPQHPGVGPLRTHWGLMHLMLQWVSHHEHPANPQPWGG